MPGGPVRKGSAQGKGRDSGVTACPGWICPVGFLWLLSLQGDCFYQGRTRDPTPHPKRGGREGSPAAPHRVGLAVVCWLWGPHIDQTGLDSQPALPRPSSETTIQLPASSAIPGRYSQQCWQQPSTLHVCPSSSPRSVCEDRYHPVHSWGH